MSKANHLNSQAARLVANLCMCKVAAVIANTTASKVDTTGTGAATVGGTMLAIAAQDELVLSALAASDLPSALANWTQPSGRPGFYTQPSGTTVYYVIGVVNNGGSAAWKVVQGTFDPVAAQSTTLDPQQVATTGGLLGGYAANGRSVIPDVPDGFTPVTVMKVVSGAAAFVPATTVLTGIATFKDVGVLPVDGTF